MQITIDIDDSKVANQILDVLEQYKKKGLKVLPPKQSVSKSTRMVSDTINDQKRGSMQVRFNSILGEYAKERANVSISEDKKILQDALWEKYGQ